MLQENDGFLHLNELAVRGLDELALAKDFGGAGLCLSEAYGDAVEDFLIGFELAADEGLLGFGLDELVPVFGDVGAECDGGGGQVVLGGAGVEHGGLAG